MKKKKFSPSLYQAIIIPVMAIIVITVAWFCALMWLSGTMAALDRQAVSILQKNTEITASRLEVSLVRQWSNIGGLPSDIDSSLTEYLNSNNMTIDEFLASHEAMMEFDGPLTDMILNALRYVNANGVFVIFTNGEEEKVYDGEQISIHGLHYRDLNPNITPSDYSDIIMERGDSHQAEVRGLALDSTWQKHYELTPNNLDNFSIYLKPLEAAKKYPNLSASELSYWGGPKVMATPEGPDPTDIATYITYTMPLLYDGRVIGVIGSEVSTELMADLYLQSSDFEAIGEGGYATASFDTADILEDGSGVNITPRQLSTNYETEKIKVGTPVFIERDIFTRSHMVDDSIHVLDHTENGSALAHLSFYELDLYSENSPFKDEHWAVIGFAPDEKLFANSRELWSDTLISALVCFGLALLITSIAVAILLRPLKSLTSQIKVSHPTLIEPPAGFDIAEITILRDALNAGIERAIADAYQIAAEHEKLTLALSLATGTLFEYDFDSDECTITRFNAGYEDDLDFRGIFSVEHALNRVRDEDDFIHPEDRPALVALLSGKVERSITARINMSKLPKGIYTHEGIYAWIRFSCRIVTDNNGKKHLIGTTQDVTIEEVKREHEERAARIDPTTKLFNQKYGLTLCREAALINRTRGDLSLLVQVQLEPALECESYYGIFYTNLLNLNIAKAIKALLPEGAIMIRGGDNEMFIFAPGKSPADFRDLLYNITQLAKNIYIGENADIVLSISCGATIVSEELDIFDLSSRTNAAVRYVVEENIGAYAFFDELPEVFKKPLIYIPTPIAFTGDIEAMSLTAIALNLFERTRDIRSVINLLSRFAAARHNLLRVFVIENNTDLSTSAVTFCYDTVKTGVSCETERMPRTFYKDFEQYDSGDGVHIISSKNKPIKNVEKLLRVEGLSEYSCLACGMYVKGEIFGKIVFLHPDPDFTWTDALVSDLNETSKIIASHLSRERSDSASRAKTDFLSKISHEIRTPMNAIIGLSDIALKDKNLDPARAVDCLEKIHSSADFLLSIINDVLDMNKIESGNMTIAHNPFNLRAALDEAASMVSPLISSRGLEFITDFSLQNDYFISDRDRLKQVLVNLLGNAAKFTERGHIKFTVTQSEEGVLFSVSDTGIGVSKEDIDRIFKSYVQLDSSDKVYRGTGLGLPISNNIVALLGGQIEVRSDPGEGTEFFFTLDLEHTEPVEEAMPGVPAPDYSGYFAGRRALLVEDNDLNTEIAVEILKSAGFEVVTAANGKLGAEEYDRHEAGYFDVILMDIRMPVLDGLGSTRMIRNNLTHGDAAIIPIVAMTANAFDEDMKKSLDAGMNGYLPKPIDTAKLYELLDKIIYKR
ncbi:MAG: response regulator [Ruminococcus sp.]|jgi:signal transduction histidine kinase/CheY-like chemotaxis protein/GGDEF domain-containing protein|nr:response regulator [Ruminococcus sp.]